MKRYTKLEAAKILNISLSTLKRRMATKQIEFSTAPQSRPGEVTVYFTAEQLGITEPEFDLPPGSKTNSGLPPGSKPQSAEPEFPPPGVRNSEPEPFDKEAALRDTVFEGQHTLLGPMEPQPKQKESCTSHMDSPLPDLNAPRPLEDEKFLELWHPGNKLRTAQMYRNAGIRPLSEQEKKEGVDRAVIAAGFRKVGR